MQIDLALGVCLIRISAEDPRSGTHRRTLLKSQMIRLLIVAVHRSKKCLGRVGRLSLRLPRIKYFSLSAALARKAYRGLHQLAFDVGCDRWLIVLAHSLF